MLAGFKDEVESFPYCVCIDMAKYGPALMAAQLIFSAMKEKGMKTFCMAYHHGRFLTSKILGKAISNAQKRQVCPRDIRTSKSTTSMIATISESYAVSSADCSIWLILTRLIR